MNKIHLLGVSAFLCAMVIASAPSRAETGLQPGRGMHIANWRMNTSHTSEDYPSETNSEDLRRLKESGFRYIRMGADWAYLEPSPGTFRWSRIGDYMDSTRALGLIPILILGNGHPDYTGGEETPPSTPAEIQAFALFAATMAAHYGKGIVWEIWNEPDIEKTWRPGAYVAMASAACLAIKQTVPEAKVIGPALADVGTLVGEGNGNSLKMVVDLLHSPAATCFDALTVHPYRHGGPGPEKALEDYAKIRALIARETPPGQKPISLAVSEWGFTTAEMSPEEQANQVVRSQLVNLMAGLPLSVLYEWRDSDYGEDSPESHYGMITKDRRDKPVTATLKDAFPRLGSATFEKRLSLGASSDYLALFRGGDGKEFLAAWTTKPEGQSVKIGEKQVSLTTKPAFIDLEKGEANTIGFDAKGR